MKKITALCLAIVMIGSITSSPVWAWGGRYYGGPHYGGGGYYGGGRYGGGWGYGRGGGYGRSSFGFYFGAPFYPYPYYGYPYRYPYYYPPAIVTVPVTPPVYIQQSPPAAQQNPSGYWYYCNSPEGYYPYIKACPNGWQQVEPTPSAPSSPR
jgi:hypothetical protein